MFLDFFIFYILGFLLLISILVFIHEYGHYLFARMFKVKVESFSIGFGKEIYGWSDRNGTRWKIAPIPFGGYVKMKGEMIQQDGKQYDNDEDSFHNKPLWQKSLIVFAGPLFNLILPIFIFFFFAFFVGAPKLLPKISEVLEEGPSYSILQENDLILTIDNKEVKTFADLQQIILLSPNKEVDIRVLRNDDIIDLRLKIGSQEQENIEIGFLGIVADNSTYSSQKYSFTRSIDYTYSMYARVMNLVKFSLHKIFTGNISKEEIGGPIKIAQMSGETMQKGFVSWMFFLAMLSINLAIINLFPIPALDGGHLLMYLIQGITRKKISAKVQTSMMQIGFFFLMALMIFVIFNDITSLFK